MSKANAVIQETINEVRKYSSIPYGARLYSYDSVIDILERIKNDIDEDDTDMPVKLTEDQIESLAGYIGDKVETAIQSMDDTDMIDSDSIEMSIYRGSANVESIDVDKSNIADTATGEIESAIIEWLRENS
jgi:hypothetical protein